MVRRCYSFLVVISLTLLVSEGASAAQALSPIQLPPPRTDGGRPLMQALRVRHTTREFADEPLPLPVLSDLLWAGFGVNRPDGHRTAPSARNWQEIDIYVALAEGVYVYDAKTNALRPVVAGDLRAATGTQPFVGQAAVNLIYVSDGKKTGNASPEDRLSMTFANTGFIAQNVYLYCASEGLVSVVRASVDRPALAKRLNLRPEQQITLAQSVGYPKPTDQPVYRVGDGVAVPKLVKEVKPSYSREAMNEKIQGRVELEFVVQPDGTPADVRVVKSLDDKYGLDAEAVKAVRQWRFEPGLKDGKPVPVMVTAELTFNLKDKKTPSPFLK